MNFNCTTNPDFCNYNMVYIKYCDGTSYSGARPQPLVYNCANEWSAFPNISCGHGEIIHFKGYWLLEGVVQTLLSAPYHLDQAKQILLTGCSAGALGVILNADRIHDQIKLHAHRLHTFGVLPMSGFFLDHENIEHLGVYAADMYTLFHMAQVKPNSRCAAKFSREDSWQCFFAGNVYPHMEAPVFLLNSALDSWQIPNILLSGYLRGTLLPTQSLSGWEFCGLDVLACNASQLARLNSYMDAFRSRVMQADGALDRPGNGAFIHSCFTHCEGQSDLPWLTFDVRGVVMREAVSDWWTSLSEAEARAHTYIDSCTYGVASQCNPSCR